VHQPIKINAANFLDFSVISQFETGRNNFMYTFDSAVIYLIFINLKFDLQRYMVLLLFKAKFTW
jgi:hypothetical protein